MRPTSSILSLAVPLLASAAPTLIRRANNADVTVLQFAGVLEDLETQFYSQALSKFQASDFTAAGFSDPNLPIQQFTAIGGDESTHLTTIQDTLKSLGSSAVSGCKFDFSSALTSVAAMAPVARTVENVGVAAYLGAAHLVTDPTVLTAAASIMTVEARHQTILNLVNDATSIPQAFDIALTPNEVLAIAGGFISGCDLGIQANTALTVTNTGKITPGTKLAFQSSALNGNQANIAARHDMAGSHSKSYDSSNSNSNDNNSNSTDASATSTSTDSAASATSSADCDKGKDSGKGKSSGSDKHNWGSDKNNYGNDKNSTSDGSMSSGSSKDGSSKSSKDKGRKGKGKDNNNSGNNNNSTSSSNSTCSSTSQLFCQIIVGGAAESMSMAIDSCQIPDGLNGPAAVFITCDDNTLPNDVVQRAKGTSSVLAGPAMIFIDSESDILAGLSLTGAACEGSNSTSSSSNSTATSDSGSTSTTDSSNTSTASAGMTDSAAATSTSAAMTDSSAAAASTDSASQASSTDSAAQASSTDSAAQASSTDASAATSSAAATATATDSAAASSVVTTTINSSMAQSILSQASAAAASAIPSAGASDANGAAAGAGVAAGGSGAIGNVQYGSVPARR